MEAADSLPEMVRKAFKVAQTPRPGACYLAIPQNLDEEGSVQANLRPLLRSDVHDSAPSQSQVSRAVKVLEEARFPIVLAGHGGCEKQFPGRPNPLLRTPSHPRCYDFHGQGSLSG